MKSIRHKVKMQHLKYRSMVHRTKRVCDPCVKCSSRVHVKINGCLPLYLRQSNPFCLLRAISEPRLRRHSLMVNRIVTLAYIATRPLKNYCIGFNFYSWNTFLCCLPQYLPWFDISPSTQVHHQRMVQNSQSYTEYITKVPNSFLSMFSDLFNESISIKRAPNNSLEFPTLWFNHYYYEKIQQGLSYSSALQWVAFVLSHFTFFSRWKMCRIDEQSFDNDTYLASTIGAAETVSSFAPLFCRQMEDNILPLPPDSNNFRISSVCLLQSRARCCIPAGEEAVM